MANKKLKRTTQEIQCRIDELLTHSDISPNSWLRDIANFLDWLMRDEDWRGETEKRANAVYDYILTAKIRGRKMSPATAFDLTNRFYSDQYKKRESMAIYESISQTEKLLRRLNLWDDLMIVETEVLGEHFRNLLSCYYEIIPEKGGLLWHPLSIKIKKDKNGQEFEVFQNEPTCLLRVLLNHELEEIVDRERRQLELALKTLRNHIGFVVSSSDAETSKPSLSRTPEKSAETSQENNSTAESIMTIPDIEEITEVIEKIVQLQTKKRWGQCGNTSSQITLSGIEKFWPDKYRLFNDSDNCPSRVQSFIAEVEDPKGGETWPPDIQSLIEDVSIKMAPWQDCIDRYGPEKLRNGKEIELLLFAVNPAELTWVIRELKKFREIVETKLKQPAPDNLLSGTTATSGKQSVISSGKRNKSPHDEEPKKRSLNQKASKKNRPTATEMENRNRMVTMAAAEVKTKYDRLATVSEIMEKTKLTANQIYATASYKEGKIAKTSTKLTAEMTGSSIASSEQFGKNSVERSRANRLSKSDQLEIESLIDESMADDARDEKQYKNYRLKKKGIDAKKH